jgi:arsenical pump membrane protein
VISVAKQPMPYNRGQRRHRVEKAHYKVTNWTGYNKALRQRVDIRPQKYFGLPIQTAMFIREVRFGNAVMVIVMLAASALDVSLGLPSFCVDLVSFVSICILKGKFSQCAPRRDILSGPSSGRGTFCAGRGLQHTAVIGRQAEVVRSASKTCPAHAGWIFGTVTAVACDLINDLPPGLMTCSALTTAHVPGRVASALLIGVDLRPNLSVTGSLATIVWLTTLRCDGIEVTAWLFLKLGVVATLPTLASALGAVTFGLTW